MPSSEWHTNNTCFEDVNSWNLAIDGATLCWSHGPPADESGQGPRVREPAIGASRSVGGPGRKRKPTPVAIP
jgi:hypothetical protein